MPRLAVTVLGSLVFLAGALLVADHQLGTTDAVVRVPAAAAPSAAAPRDVAPPPAVAPPPTVVPDRPDVPAAVVPDRPGVPPTVVPDSPGVPVQLVIPFGSSHHPHGVTAPVSADPLLPNGDLFVPPHPGTVSWASQDAEPGADRGTAILVGHVNLAHVAGALSDLAEYATSALGKTFTVVLADGRRLLYQVSAGAEYDKDQLAADPDLRRRIYDQESVFGTGAGSGRLVLVSCGGAFDNRTGSYEDNIFVFAMPVG